MRKKKIEISDSDNVFHDVSESKLYRHRIGAKRHAMSCDSTAIGEDNVCKKCGVVVMKRRDKSSKQTDLGGLQPIYNDKGTIIGVIWGK